MSLCLLFLPFLRLDHPSLLFGAHNGICPEVRGKRIRSINVRREGEKKSGTEILNDQLGDFFYTLGSTLNLSLMNRDEKNKISFSCSDQIRPQTEL